MRPERHYEDPIRVWQCGNCSEEFENKADARNCCATWYCGDCGEEYDDRQDAKKCCERRIKT